MSISTGPASLALAPGPGQGRAVLTLLCRQGALTQVADEVYLPTHQLAWPVARCDALRLLVRPGWVVGLSTSVWARGGPGRSAGGPAPDGRHGPDHMIDLLVPPGTGPRRHRTGLRLRQTRVLPDDAENVHGVWVSTLGRAAADLLLWGSGRDDPALAWLWARGVDPAQTWQHLVARGRVAGRHRAALVLELVASGCDDPLARAPVDDPACYPALTPSACP